MDKLETILKALPGITAAAFIAAIVYGFGYFAPFGTEWITTLSIKDVLSMTWASLPTVLLGFTLSFVTRTTTPGPGVTTAKKFWTHAERFPKIYIFLLLLRMFIILLAFTGPIIFMIMKSPIPNADMHRFLMPLTLTHLVGLAGLQIISSPKDRAATLLPAMVYGALVMVVVFGAIDGYGKAMKEPSYRVIAREGQVSCATLVLAGERGAIFYDPLTEAVTLTRWEEIRSIAKLKHCSTPARKQSIIPKRTPNSGIQAKQGLAPSFPPPS